MNRVLAIPFSAQYVNVDAAAGAAALVTQPTNLNRIIILTAGSTAITFYDNKVGDSSGSKVATLPAVTVAGQVYEFLSPCFVGLSASGGAGTPEYRVVHTPTQAN